VRLVFDLRGDGLAGGISGSTAAARAEFELRAFPDGETYLRIDCDVRDADAVIVADLSRPDPKVLPTLLLADTLRAQGAAAVNLVAPYLPYMRQDRAFNPGESVSSRHFAALLSTHIDRLVTVDAHLHRYASLAEIYSVPAQNLSAAPLLGDWVREHVPDPLLVGPDRESEQWVQAAAERAGCPWTVFTKARTGDRSVRISGTVEPALRERRPVLLDDVISTGTTLAECCSLLRGAGMRAPCVVAVHGIFAGESCAALERAGVDGIVTTNSVPHRSNRIDIAPLLVAALLEPVR
jgi:ribose-phosphate pyrophosphokinase